MLNWKKCHLATTWKCSIHYYSHNWTNELIQRWRVQFIFHIFSAINRLMAHFLFYFTKKHYDNENSMKLKWSVALWIRNFYCFSRSNACAHPFSIFHCFMSKLLCSPQTKIVRFFRFFFCFNQERMVEGKV